MHTRLPLYDSLSTMAVQVWGSGALGYATERASGYRRLPCGFMQEQPGVRPRAWGHLKCTSQKASQSAHHALPELRGRWFLTLVCGYGLPPNVHTWSLHVCIHENLKNNSNVNRLCFSFNIGFFLVCCFIHIPPPPPHTHSPSLCAHSSMLPCLPCTPAVCFFSFYFI